MGDKFLDEQQNLLSQKQEKLNTEDTGMTPDERKQLEREIEELQEFEELRKTGKENISKIGNFILVISTAEPLTIPDSFLNTRSSRKTYSK